MNIFDLTKNSYFPKEHNKMGAIATTESTELTSGSLTIGNVYTIVEVPTGGTPAFAGASELTLGTTFVATDTTATWGTTNTGKLVDVTTGKPTILAYYNDDDLVFQWNYIYNSDDNCVSFTVTDKNLNRFF